MDRQAIDSWIDDLRMYDPRVVVSRSAVLHILFQMDTVADDPGCALAFAKGLIATPQRERLECVCDQDLYVAFWALGKFHKNGSFFRYLWNESGKEEWENYAAYLSGIFKKNGKDTVFSEFETEYLVQHPFRNSSGNKR